MRVRYAKLADLSSFDEIIDVRTPAEFALDHIPGAINAPVLSNDERVLIGTLYRSDPFGATRLGASLVAANISEHLKTGFSDRPPKWRPVIYCWRGGKRSASMTTWFNLIGWHAEQLAGGYKSYRRWVLDQLDVFPARLNWIVLRGLTGSGKTRLLSALNDIGAQVLDLEALARHRGSLLGAWPGHAQPSQKRFDGDLVAALASLKSDQPVFMEAESRGIGSIRLPTPLMTTIEDSPSVEVITPHPARIAFLCSDYAHLFQDPAFFKSQLERLRMLHGRAIIERWHALIDAHDATTLFTELIDLHYDPAYRRSLRVSGDDVPSIEIDPLMDLRPAAERLLLLVQTMLSTEHPSGEKCAEPL